MEIAFTIFATVSTTLITVLWAGMVNHSGKLKELKEELRQFKDETYLKQIEPQVKEYLELKGLSYSNIQTIDGLIYNHGVSQFFSPICKLYELEDKLAALKKDLERNCPKKCKKVKK